MKDRIKKAILILKCERHMTDSGRFRFLACFLGMIHLMITAIGVGIGCMPLTISGLIALLVDVGSLFIGRSTGNYFHGISVIYFMTCSQSLYACWSLGWTFGFSLYNLAMIPVLFYMMYMTQSVRYPRKYAWIYMLINSVATLTIRRFVYLGEPEFYYEKATAFWVSFFNNTASFICAMAFSMLFILELETQTQKLKRMADYDGLTQLRNRRSMLDEWKALKRLDYCVVMGDIDDFKKINDTYGHEEGDQVLKLVADSMQEAVDQEDYVSRWGGEEFLMIVFGNIPYAMKVIDKVQRRLEKAELMAAGQRITVTMTFGISERSEVSDGNIDELISKADHRLYLGKRSGKNCIKIKDE